MLYRRRCHWLYTKHGQLLQAYASLFEHMINCYKQNMRVAMVCFGFCNLLTSPIIGSQQTTVYVQSVDYSCPSMCDLGPVGPVIGPVWNPLGALVCTKGYTQTVNNANGFGSQLSIWSQIACVSSIHMVSSLGPHGRMMGPSLGPPRAHDGPKLGPPMGPRWAQAWPPMGP
jgi:hypothetical protein